jgi:hypothetical protein
MCVAAKIMLRLSIELEDDGRPWPHPWDYYPLVTDGKYIWLRYQDLNAEQREQIRRTLVRVSRGLRMLSLRSQRTVT